MALYKIFNFAMITNTAPAGVTTGTALKTLLQVKPSATNPISVVEWGISFSGSAAATPVYCELIETDTAATVTACGVNDIIKYDATALMSGSPITDLIQVGTTATGFTCPTTEGTVAASRMFDCQQVAPTNQYVFQFQLGRQPLIQPAKFARIRVKATGSGVDATCYMLLEV